MSIHKTYKYYLSPDSPSISEKPKPSTVFGSSSSDLDEIESSEPASVPWMIGAQYPTPTYVQLKDLDKYIPKNIDKHVLVYMSGSLLNSERVIPLWSPSPGLEMDPQKWMHYVDIGDVGFLTDEGGFDTLFNIFLTPEENRHHHYTPPEDFVHLNVTPAEKSNMIKLEDVMLHKTKAVSAIGVETIPEGRYEN
ncbi:hypothetical protein BDN70DRAFT_898107 [Pholiota conissans]|uniref:Uncharacterized protein n=1 Tax=Pholiota conissans TaxID=109636 RepID=A0A9P6CWC7_9AGAR|nr:hypothetical protein BDN70DRAFT_898107 [Pholiota conissans]